ncbi:MAG: YHS domain-containing protein, partial [Halieaceae bacterium]|nr:YHS domain-containing protein [Halieaceae bacterium]
TAFHTWIPSDEELDWLSAKYPETFDKYYRPRWEMAKEMADKGERYYNEGLPQLCQTCQIPMIYTDVQNDPRDIVYRSTKYQGERFHFCSDQCQHIFENEPEKYVHAWLPVHQIFQGNCGGPGGLEKVMDYYKLDVGKANMDYVGSPDEERWKNWKGVA